MVTETHCVLGQFISDHYAEIQRAVVEANKSRHPAEALLVEMARIDGRNQPEHWREFLTARQKPADRIHVEIYDEGENERPVDVPYRLAERLNSVERTMSLAINQMITMGNRWDLRLMRFDGGAESC